MPPDGRFLNIAAGPARSCAIAEDHTVVCWGSDVTHGLEVPAGAFQDRHGRRSTMRRPHWLTAASRVGAQAPTRIPTAWIPKGSTLAKQSPPTGLFAIFAPATDILAASVRTAPWPAGVSGRCSATARTRVSVARRRLRMANSWKSICGLSHTCAIREDGTVACWGSNNADRSTPPSDLKVF